MINKTDTIMLYGDDFGATRISTRAKLNSSLSGEVEAGSAYRGTYTLINRGDGVRCGWCDMLVEGMESEFVDGHIQKHVKDDELKKSEAV